METTNNTAMEISLREVLAACLRGGKKIVIFTMIFAILFGAFAALDYYVLSEDPDEGYRLELEEYEFNKGVLEAAVERAKKEVEKQKAYNENSQLMQINPYDKITTTLVFTISGVKLEEVTDPFLVTETPISYAKSLIQAQYVGAWNGLDLGQVAAGTRYEGVGDKYLRELIHLEPMNGGVLQMTVAGSSAQECEQIVKALYAALQQCQEAVTEASYEHELTVLNDINTQSSVDMELEKQQTENKDKLEKYLQSLVEAEKALQALAAPAYEGGMKNVISNVIFGALVGAFATVICLVVAHFIKGRVSGSKQLATRYKLIHLGSLTKSNGLWKKLGYAVMGEKLWKDAKQAQSYIAENCAYHLSEEGPVVVATTLDNLEEDVKAQMIDILGAKGRTVAFAMDVEHNPEALKAMAQGSSIILAERAFESRNATVKELLKKAKELNKPVCGFVML